jgi:hypothetical protein
MHTSRLRFDIGLLASRLIGATDWLKGYHLQQNPYIAELDISYFGVSTDIAALVAMIYLIVMLKWVFCFSITRSCSEFLYNA